MYLCGTIFDQYTSETAVIYSPLIKPPARTESYSRPWTAENTTTSSSKELQSVISPANPINGTLPKFVCQSKSSPKILENIQIALGWKLKCLQPSKSTTFMNTPSSEEKCRPKISCCLPCKFAHIKTWIGQLKQQLQLRTYDYPVNFDSSYWYSKRKA